MWLVTCNFNLKNLQNALLLIDRVSHPSITSLLQNTASGQLISAIILQLHLPLHKGLLMFLSKGSASLEMP